MNGFLFWPNSDLDDRDPASDLFPIADIGRTARRIIKCNKDTLNTPYKAGLTSGIDTGTAIISMGSVNYGVIFYLPDGGTSTAPYICKKTNGTWGGWVKLAIKTDTQAGNVTSSVSANSYVDIPISFDTPFNAAPAIVVGFNGKPATIGAWCYCYAHSITSKEFSIRITNVTNGAANPSVHWVACAK